jgi:branched-chain amino acid transport system substrate-binding protein
MNILMEAHRARRQGRAEAIRDALRQTDYKAPNGRYRFTAKGEGYGFDVVLVQIRNKEPKVAAESAMKAKP